MLNFIICDDDKKMRERLKDAIQYFMKDKDIEYKVYTYADYDDDFLKIINKKLSFKIYILDIETPTRTGLDIAHRIRIKDNDSAIIFITGHEELGPRLLTKDIAFLAFINKFDNCIERLYTNLEKSIEAIQKKKTLRIEEHGILYTIHLDDILYITRDSYDRKTIIKTDGNEFRVSMPISKLFESLDKRFIQTHRACYVNKERVECFNKSLKDITFDNGVKIDLISSRFDIKELVR